VILLANQDKVAASDALIRVRTELERHRVDVRIAAPDKPVATEGALMLVVFGGDGTLLAAARMYASTGVPILPIHVGRFGFITESDSTQVWSHVASALEGALEVHTRAMLYASVECEGKVISASSAVNDVVVACSSRRLVDLDVHVDNDLVAGYAADGVVVASPTGSTGYALSIDAPGRPSHFDYSNRSTYAECTQPCNPDGRCRPDISSKRWTRSCGCNDRWTGNHGCTCGWKGFHPKKPTWIGPRKRYWDDFLREGTASVEAG